MNTPAPKPKGYRATAMVLMNGNQKGQPVPPPVPQHRRILGVQHELEWGIAVVGLRPTVKSTCGLRDILVQVTSLFYGEGVELLSLSAGNMQVLRPINQDIVRYQAIESTYSLGPDTPAILVLKVEPLVAQMGISLTMVVPTDAVIDLEVKTLDLMPLDCDPSTINFQGLLWPNE